MVVDASALVHVLLRTPGSERAEAALLGHTLHAPHLVDIEAASAFRRLAAMGEIGAERGRLMLALLGDLPIRRYPHMPLMPRVWGLRAHVTAYDAVYVALAEALDVPLLTRDARLARAAEHLIAVELV